MIIRSGVNPIPPTLVESDDSSAEFSLGSAGRTVSTGSDVSTCTLARQGSAAVDGDNQICAICMSKIEEITAADCLPKAHHALKSKQAITLECGHHFHISCIEQWGFVKGRCPLDRQPIVSGLVNPHQAVKFIGSHVECASSAPIELSPSAESLGRLLS